MTVRLVIRRASWRARIAELAASTPGLVPVVKGRGYGIGQDVLMPIAAELGGTIAVGSVHEVDGVPADRTPVVLTPTLRPPARDDAVMTVASPAHIDALRGWHGRVMLKLASSMRRYGAAPGEFEERREAIEATGLELVGYSVHLPTAGTEDGRCAEARQWAARLPAGSLLSVSHLTPETYTALAAEVDHVEWRLRAGTALWHRDKSALELTADVLGVRPVSASERVGYRQVEIPADGHLVMVGAGTANAVAPLPSPGGAPLSPFHFARRRLALVEIHMHTSIVLATADGPVPVVGDWIDLQRPLVATIVDELEWR